MTGMLDLATPRRRAARTVEKLVVPPPIGEDTTVRHIAAMLASSARFERLHGDYMQEAEAIAHYLKPYGITPKAAQMALSLTHKEGGGRRGTAHVPNARLAEHGATLEGQVRAVRDDEVFFRAAYIANAAQRMQRSMNAGATQRDALRAEIPHYQSHERARRGRLTTASQVQIAAKAYGWPTPEGTLVGWYLNPMLNNEVECQTANGSNFYAEKGTVIGLPGSVHLNCGCYAGPPHSGAGMVNDKLHNVVKMARHAKPYFKLKKGRAS